MQINRIQFTVRVDQAEAVDMFFVGEGAEDFLVVLFKTEDEVTYEFDASQVPALVALELFAHVERKFS